MAQPWPRKHATRRVPIPIDETKVNDLPGRFVTDPGGTGHVTATEQSHPSPIGTWTIDPADRASPFACRKLRLWTVTGRQHGLGIIHLDDLPPVGVIRFQPSGLPVLTMALDPTSVETGDTDPPPVLDRRTGRQLARLGHASFADDHPHGAGQHRMGWASTEGWIWAEGFTPSL
jgi:hypothetical protein